MSGKNVDNFLDTTVYGKRNPPLQMAMEEMLK